MSYHHYLLIPILLLAGIPPTTTAQQTESVIPGTLSVKFTGAAVDAIDISSEDAFVTTGLSSVDQLNAQFGVTEMTRVFRPAGRFEERHRAFGLHRWYTLHVPQDLSVQAAVDAYRADPNVEIAEPVYEKTFNDGYDSSMEPQIVDAPGGPRTARGNQAIPNDIFFGYQWHYHNIGQNDGTPGADISLPEAHGIQSGHSSVVVSIHDQGIQTDHEDLAAAMWINEGETPGNGIDDDENGYVDDVYGYNFAQNQGAIAPGDHGTHVAGTVGAVTNNETGVAGVAGGDGAPESGVRLMSTQVFVGTTGGSGFAESYTYAADMGAVISQNSWGYGSPGIFEQVVLDAIDYYIANAGGPSEAMDGGLVIFSAGNSDHSGDWYPGFHEPTVAVSSTNIYDQKSVWSNFGEWVDVSAPGGTNNPPFGVEDVASTITDDRYGFLAGTSMACPHVSGVAVLIASQDLGSTNEQVRTILEETTDDIDPVNPGYEGLLGTGRINAATAVGAEADTTGPGVITDLTGIPDGEAVTLTWTAPDDNVFGVQNYYVRYAQEPIEDENDWDAATVVPGAAYMAPQEPGATEELVVTGFTFETTYYFVVRSDDSYNVSGLSNSEEVTTLAPPVATVPTDPIEVALPAEGADTYEYTIANAGPSTLSYVLRFAETTPAVLNSREAIPRPEVSGSDEAPEREGEEHPSSEPAPAEAGGEPQLMGEGGPDEFGYRWVDSNEPGGPVYEWIDISETGTELELGLDDHEVIDLPFDFPYYENTYDWVAIQSKGALSFEADFIGHENQPIPSEEGQSAIVAGYWDDLDPSATSGGGTVYYYTLDDGRFVVTWEEVPFYLSDTEYVTVQIIVEPGGTIVTQYKEIVADNSVNSATIGIENLDGTDGLEVVYNAPYVEEELAVRFTPLWVFSNLTAGQIAAGGDETLIFSFEAGGLDPGTYTADMTVMTNEQSEGLQEYVVPITLTVEGIGTEDDDLAFEGTHRLSAIAPNPVNGLAQATLEVAEAQDVTVELFDVRGRKVATPFEGILATRTAHELGLDGSIFAPGVYVLRIIGETFSETRRVTILR